ncbi:EamA family transporter [Methylobrevis pamukkalensis]|uniref:EamA family transporter n=1 Tax=Methylobrevis pamukkalensis TaxID=1439726 RepID=UPI001FD97E84|nr:EamA family transporter [Methylobrevis pamukkalensis]
MLLVVALALEPTLWPATAAGAAALLGLALVSHAGGQGLLAFALGHVSAAFSSVVVFLEAIAAALFAWAIFAETPGPDQIAGGALILVGIWIARPRQGQEARAQVVALQDEKGRADDV